MKSSKNQFSCYMTFFGNFPKKGLYQVQAAARHETIIDCPRGITMSFFLDFTVANSFKGSDVMNWKRTSTFPRPTPVKLEVSTSTNITIH